MLFIYTTIYFLATLFYYIGFNYIASILMVALAILLYLLEMFSRKRIINIRGLFVLGFVGGFGVSLLKLSNLSNRYNLMTFLVVFVSYFSIYIGGYFSNKRYIKDKKMKNTKIALVDFPITVQNIFLIGMIIISFVAFIVEVLALGFIPVLQSDTPHAYSTFHIFGVHYITTLYIFIPSIALCNYFMSEKEKKDVVIVIFSLLYSIIMSLVLVSRAQLIASIVLSLFVLLISKSEDIFKNIVGKKFIIKIFAYSIIAIILFLAFYIVITIFRAHNVEYLNEIFDMKNKKMPIYISQPYMYISQNFENLNYMIENIFRHTFGRRVLYPLFTLTLIKKFFPIVVDSPYYIIKEELSTVTLVYDFYYDFGLIGVIVFCFIIGYIGTKVENMVYEMLDGKYFVKNNYKMILLALFSYYMLFSFFQSYFSLTDTWIHIFFIMIISSCLIMTKNKSKVKEVKYENNKNEELQRNE